MKIGDFNTEEKVLVIAEIGNNHEGDFALAKKMIRLASASGANAVKFQAIVPERLVSSNQSDRIAQLRRFSLSPDQFKELKQVAEDEKVIFLATPFDLQSVNWLDELVPAWKISSGDNNFTPLLDRVATTGKPVIISLGLGCHDNSATLLAYFNSAWRKHGKKESEIALLHCVASYPTPDEEASLTLIRSLSVQGATPGYSDHTLGMKAPELAVAAGARIIEKHFTTNNSYSDFRDHQLSANPKDFAEMVNAIRRVERMLHSSSKIQSCESSNEIHFRRSLAAGKDLPEGVILRKEDLIWVRPGTGIPLGGELELIGKKTSQEIKYGELLSRAMFSP